MAGGYQGSLGSFDTSPAFLLVMRGHHWTLERPFPDIVNVGGISCPTSRQCTVIGTSEFGVPASYRYDDGTWRELPAPPLELARLDCPSSSFCLSFGSDGRAYDLTTEPGWMLDPHQPPTTTPGSFSCSTPDECVLLTPDDPGTALRRTVQGWSAVALHGPPGFAATWVDCPSAGRCVVTGTVGAVPRLVGASRTDALIVSLPDGSVRDTRIPLPRAVASTALTALSCPDAGQCLAVGSSDLTPAHRQALAAITRGRRTILTRLPFPTTDTFTSALAAVSCTAGLRCVAVGTYTRLNNAPQLLAEAFDGHRWTVLSPLPDDENSNATIVTGVDCVRANLCYVIGAADLGDHETGGEVWTWNGSTWFLQSTGYNGNYLGLHAISCPTANTCVALGDSALLSIVNGLVQQAIPIPYSTNDSIAYTRADLSCTAVDRCVIVGSQQDAYIPVTDYLTHRALVQVLDGTSWTAVTPADAGPLTSVDCTPLSCEAVGTRLETATPQILSTRNRDATIRWEQVRAPHILGATTLTAIECPTTTACRAVGSAVPARGGATPFLAHD